MVPATTGNAAYHLVRLNASGQLSNSILQNTNAPVSAIDYRGNYSISGINGLSPVSGDVVVATDSGTPTAGTSDALTAGDVAEFDGTQWQKIVSASGGYVPAGTRLLVAIGTIASPLTDNTDEGKIAVFSGSDNTPTLQTPIASSLLPVLRSSGSVNAAKLYVIEGTGASAGKTLVAGVSDHGGLTGLSDDDHTQYLLADGTRALTGPIQLDGIKRAVTEINSNTTLGTQDVVMVDDSGGNITVTLPAATGTGREYTIKKMSASNATTVDANGSETIDGATSRVLNAQYESVTVVDAASGEWIITA